MDRQRRPMTIILNHTIVPARNKVAAARFFADTFGLDFDEQENGRFAPVRVNETLTLLFDEDTSFDSHHYAFHVSDAEFDSFSSASRRLDFHAAALLGAPTTANSTTPRRLFQGPECLS
jgi:catechol 2,3-dioxygenase-like lactoylglutathione lyase family enzyme